MMRKLFLAALGAAFLGAVAAWVLSAPQRLNASEIPVHDADVANGERIFHTGGCTSCHAAPGAKDADKLMLGGGLELPSPFGIFRVPNISPDTDNGIGGWSDLEFVNALMRGVSPSGAHYYPSFPFTSYQRMKLTDVLDLKAFMDTLPPVATANREHDLPFPFNIRRSLGLWKLMFSSAAPAVALVDVSEPAQRGQYLVEGPGHCGECHTPRNFLGGSQMGRWLAGGPNPEGEGSVPNITNHGDGLEEWTQDDIASYLETGLSPSFEVVGGSMQAVQANMAKLPDEDRAAIAAYLKAVPAHPNGYSPADRR